MQLACPNCGTRDVRVSHPRSFGEYLKYLVGVSNLRCRRCNGRWETSVWASGSWRYARCPRCYRQELTKWTEHHYNPSRWTRLLLRLGATPLRCPACRCNFAGFRSRKKEFSWRHEIRTEAPAGQTPPVEESEKQIP